MAILFRATKALEAQIDEYLDTISQGVLIFKEGVRNYLEKSDESFEDHLASIDSLEAKADDLRRNIESNLYSHSLIPEHRGDVLGLLESIDDVIDTAKETLNQFSIEIPYIPEILNKEYIELTNVATNAADEIVTATRAFFKDINKVKDHLHKVYFYEKEADKAGYRLKRQIFRTDNIDLSQKFHLRHFALHIDIIADMAENVADRLAIYTIKRTL
jgi:predicted phosphate transport protein (TIGR00153 family)